MPATPREVFAALVDGVSKLVAGDRSQVDRLAALYAEQTHVTHPMAPLGDTPLLTREALREHFAKGPGSSDSATFRGFRAEEVRLHDTTDPEVVIAEFVYVGEGDDAPFRVPCVFVVRVRDGLIVESHDYTNHLEFARIAGRLDGLVGALRAA